MTHTVRKVYWHPLSGWQADCVCGYTSGEREAFEAVMDVLEAHWFPMPEVCVTEQSQRCA